MENLKKIFEVVEDASAQIPEGVYLQLMNLLKNQHEEITEKGGNPEELNAVKATLKKTIEIAKILNDDNERLERELKEKDLEILYEKKKSNALIKHIGGEVEFNKSFNKFKFQHNRH